MHGRVGDLDIMIVNGLKGLKEYKGISNVKYAALYFNPPLRSRAQCTADQMVHNPFPSAWTSLVIF